MCLGWMDYCFRFFLICPLPPAPCHGSSGGPAYVMVGPGESAGRTLNWKLVIFLHPSPEFPLLLLVTGFSFFFFLFFFLPWGRKSWYQTDHLTLLTLAPPTTRQDPGNSSIPVVQLSCDLNRLDLRTILFYPPHSPVRPPLWRALCTHYNPFAFFIW